MSVTATTAISIAIGSAVKVHGRHIAKVLAIHRNGKTAHVVGPTYDGFTALRNLTVIS